MVKDYYEIHHKKHLGYELEKEWGVEYILDFDLESNFKNIFSWLDQLTVNYSGKLIYGKSNIKVIENILNGKRNGKLLKFQNNKVLYSYNYLNDKVNGKNFEMSHFVVEIAESILQYVGGECNYEIYITFKNNMKKITFTYYDKNELKYVKRISLNKNGKVIKLVWLNNYCKIVPYKKIKFNKNSKVLCKFNDKLKIELELFFKNLKIK